MMHPGERDIDAGLACRLLAEQFPQWAHLRLTRVPSAGTVNAIYRLGDDMAVRLPRMAWAVESLEREWRWLPRLSPHLPLAAPVPLARGEPSGDYPWPWAITPWFDGEALDVARDIDARRAAQQLAGFVRALQELDPSGGPAPRPTERGRPLGERDARVRQAIADSGRLGRVDLRSRATECGSSLDREAGHPHLRSVSTLGRPTGALALAASVVLLIGCVGGPAASPQPTRTESPSPVVTGGASPGGAPAATVEPPSIPDLLAQVEEARLREHVERLSAFVSRHPAHPGHALAAAYLEEELRSYGAGAVRVAPEGSGPGTRNVYVTYGPDADGVTIERPADIVLAAHYDSIAVRTPGYRPERDPAPGANDNGTGVAGLLEVARLLAEEERAGRLARTVTVVFFDGEELGMNGSKHWVEEPALGGSLLINLDMVGFSAPGVSKVDLMRYPGSGELPKLAQAANERYGIGLRIIERAFPPDLSVWVDSTPFAIAGIPAITLTESYGQPGIDYPGYPAFHTTGDLPHEINNAGQWLAAVRLLLAMTLELARR